MVARDPLKPLQQPNSTGFLKVAGRLLERRLKEILLEAARRQGVSAARLAERIEEETGLRVPRSWEGLVRFVLSSGEIDERELAAILVDLGVEVPEEEWINLVSRYRLKAPRLSR